MSATRRSLVFAAKLVLSVLGPLVLSLAIACTSGGGGIPQGADLRQEDGLLQNTDGLAPLPDGAAQECIGQSECACLAKKGACQSLGEVCHCPYPQCGPGSCICGGGKFLGCAPIAGGCTNPVTCRPAWRPGPQDARGCIACQAEQDCQRAFDQMVGSCADKKGLLGAFSCAKNSSCVTNCINQVAACGEIGCGLCTTCRCQMPGAFEQCFSKCLL